MDARLVATSTTSNPTRMAGSYQAAWLVTIGDKTGYVVHSFDYDKRDIMNETIVASESIAATMLAEINDEYWDPAMDGFYDDGQRIQDDAVMKEALEAVTETIYDTP